MKNYKSRKIEQFTNEMIAFEEMTVEEKKPELRAKFTLDFLSQTIDEMLECLPKKATEGDGWEMLNELEMESCCPGDDIASGFNSCRSQFLENIKNKIK